MVRARLHVICGNCGDNTMLTHIIDLKGGCDNDGKEFPVVSIICANCSTIHHLEDTVEEEKKV
jgi:hypothetical protein